MLPDRVSVPAFRWTPPAPWMEPPKSPSAPVRVSVLAPRNTWPAPPSVLTCAPEVVAEMSKIPLSCTPADWAMEPPPASTRADKGSMVVPPV